MVIEHQCISGFPDVPKKQEKQVDRNSPWENVGQINFPSSLKLSFWMKTVPDSYGSAAFFENVLIRFKHPVAACAP